MGANAQTSVPVFTAGQVLTAQQQTEINTGIPVFATTTTRDAAFGGTGEKTLAEGQMAYIENIAGSSAVQYYDGAAWQTLVVSGLTLITAQTIGSAVSSVTVSNCFSSTYDNYFVTISGGVASADNVGYFQVGSATTAYYASRIGIVYSSGATDSGRVNGGANFAASWIHDSGSLNGAFTLIGPNLAKKTFLYTQLLNGNTGQSSQWYGGFLNDTTQHTGFTVGPGVGTLTGGTIRVYGYQNS
jgi:hypothetical protein